MCQIYIAVDNAKMSNLLLLSGDKVRENLFQSDTRRIMVQMPHDLHSIIVLLEDVSCDRG